MRIILGILIGLGIATIGVQNFMGAIGTSILIMKESWQEMYDPEYRKSRIEKTPQPAPAPIDKVKGTVV